MDEASNQLLKVFGLRVRYLRLKKGWTQEELGFQTNLHRTYIGSIERGEKNISLKNIDLIARAFGIEIQELFNFKEPNDGLDKQGSDIL
jgi:transcriptional regulator with XRE-family HTH domain